MIQYPILVSPKRASMITDVLDAWLEEMEPATQDVERDRTHSTAEDLLEALSGMHDTFKELQAFRAQLGAIVVSDGC